MKYKKGDKVLIIHYPIGRDGEHDTFLRDGIGQIGTIININNVHAAYDYRVCWPDGQEWGYCEDQLSFLTDMGKVIYGE